jgi:hypothetical protein
MIPVQSGQHRLSVHLPESVLFPTRFARIESQHYGIQSEFVLYGLRDMEPYPVRFRIRLHRRERTVVINGRG